MNNLDISKISSNTVYLYYNNNKDLTYEEKYFSTILKNLVREIILNEDKKILKKWNIEWRKYKKNTKENIILILNIGYLKYIMMNMNYTII